MSETLDGPRDAMVDANPASVLSCGGSDFPKKILTFLDKGGYEIPSDNSNGMRVCPNASSSDTTKSPNPAILAGRLVSSRCT